MNANQKLKLGEMINANKDTYIDQTELIRELKHSHLFRRDIQTLQNLMAAESPEDVAIMAITDCSFLCTYYTDLYNKIRKNEMDMKMLFTFIDTLELIENGKLDQNEASMKVGEILKKIYVDSALKKANKLDAQGKEIRPDGDSTAAEPVEAKVISYAEYKARRSCIEAKIVVNAAASVV